VHVLLKRTETLFQITASVSLDVSCFIELIDVFICGCFDCGTNALPNPINPPPPGGLVGVPGHVQLSLQAPGVRGGCERGAGRVRLLQGVRRAAQPRLQPGHALRPPQGPGVQLWQRRQHGLGHL